MPLAATITPVRTIVKDPVTGLLAYWVKRQSPAVCSCGRNREAGSNVLFVPRDGTVFCGICCPKFAIDFDNTVGGHNE
jgi:hypothetical protein